MSSFPWIDSKYVSIVGTYLENFTNKGGNRWNCRCPICGDSAKDRQKSRGWFIQRGTNIIYHCFNCDVTMSVGKFLRQNFPELYKDWKREYVIEKYGVKTPEKKKEQDAKKQEFSERTKKLVRNLDSKSHSVLSEFKKLRELPKDHPAIKWFASRKLPLFLLNDSYYIHDIAPIKNSLQGEDLDEIPCSRVGFPIWNRDRSLLVGITMRDITGRSKNKYLVIRNKETDLPLLYGLDRLNLEDPIKVFEGPIDSTFIPNGCAVGNGGVDSAKNHPDLQGCELIYVFDNQPRHKQVVELMNDSISKGLRVAFWDELISEKDVNDCVLAGYDVSFLDEMFLSAPTSVLKRKLMFSKWRKI